MRHDDSRHSASHNTNHEGSTDDHTNTNHEGGTDGHTNTNHEVGTDGHISAYREMDTDGHNNAYHGRDDNADGRGAQAVERSAPGASVGPLSHLDAHGHMHMVDVGAKSATHRIAIAEASVRLNPSTCAALRDAAAPKGDVLAAARLAGIQAAKRTWELIPLCHPVPLTHVAVQLDLHAWGVHVRAQAETVSATGVEMEAMTAAGVAALTLYDMLKGMQRDIVIDAVRLVEKRGGRSGVWKR